MTRNVRLVFLTNALLLLFSVITSLLSAWALKPEGRGDLTIITVWLFVFSLAGTLGLPLAHRYWTAREPAWQSEIFSNTVAYTLIAGFIMTVIAWFVVPLLTDGRSPEIVRFTQLFTLNIPIILLTEMLRGQLEGARLFGWVGAARLSFITTQAVGYLIFYFFGWLTLENAIFIIVAAQIICPLIMVWGVLKKLRPRWSFSWKVFREEIGYGLRSYFGIITGFAVLRLDQIMLAIVAPSQIVGLYTVAVALAEITATLASSVADALMPEVAAANNPKESALLVGKSLRLMFYAHFTVLIPLWAAAPYILKMIYGESFVAATGALRLLLLASIVWSAGLTVISGLDGFGRPGLSTIARLASTVTTVAALLVLLPRYGILGAAGASLLGYSTLLFVALFCFLRQQRIGFWEFLRPRRADISYGKIKSLLGFSMLRRADGKI
jgi:O-antigen/teichoic acid export membrane protein